MFDNKLLREENKDTSVIAPREKGPTRSVECSWSSVKDTMGSDHDDDNHEEGESKGAAQRRDWILSRAKQTLKALTDESFEKMEQDEERNDRWLRPSLPDPRFFVCFEQLQALG